MNQYLLDVEASQLRLRSTPRAPRFVPRHDEGLGFRDPRPRISRIPAIENAMT